MISGADFAGYLQTLGLDAEYKAYNPNQPRDERGRFGSGGQMQQKKTAPKAGDTDKAKADKALRRINRNKNASFDPSTYNYDPDAKDDKDGNLTTKRLATKEGRGDFADYLILTATKGRKAADLPKNLIDFVPDTDTDAEALNPILRTVKNLINQQKVSSATVKQSLVDWIEEMQGKPGQKAYNPDQPRDYHGRFGSGGDEKKKRLHTPIFVRP